MTEPTQHAELVRLHEQVFAEFTKPWSKDNRPLPKGYREGYDAALSLVLEMVDALIDG